MKINCLEKNNIAAFLVFRMMCQLDEKQENRFNVRELFGMNDIGNEVDIKMTINGVEVDVIECLNKTYRIMNSDFDDRVLSKANELVSLSGLEDLQAKLKQAEWDISSAIDEALKKVKK